MAELRFTAAARQDLVDIFEELTSRVSLAIAERYEHRFDDAFDLFERYPGLGAPRSELGEGTRIWAVPPYVIFYELAVGDVLVLRVLHGHRAIKPGLLRSED